jgi:hypothetical protein
MGAATSLGFLCFWWSWYTIATTPPTKRKYFLGIGSILLFTTNIIKTYKTYSEFYRNRANFEALVRYDMMTSPAFIGAVCFLSLASCQRYLAFDTTQKRPKEIFLSTVTVAICLYAFAIDEALLKGILHRNWLAIIIVIPLGHIVFGMALYLEQIKRTVDSNSAGYTMARWQVDINICLVLLWILWLLTFFLNVSSADLDGVIAGTAFLVECSVATITTSMRKFQQSKQERSSKHTHSASYVGKGSLLQK